MGTKHRNLSPREAQSAALRERMLEYLKEHPGLSISELAIALESNTRAMLYATGVAQAEGLIIQSGERRIPRAQGGVMTYPGWVLIGEATRRHSKMNNRELGCDVQHILLGLGRARE